MDTILHGLLFDSSIAVYAVDGKDLVSTAQRTHTLSRVATAALGRQLLMTALLASQLKHDSDRVTTILQGDGVSGNLVCTGRFGALVKGYATNGDAELPLNAIGKLDVSGFVGSTGKLTVIRDLSLKEPYVGVSNLISGEIAEDFAQYFTASEQQPTLCYLGVHEHALDGEVTAAGGILVQPLPGCDPVCIDAVVMASERISQLGDQLAAHIPLEDCLSAVFKGMSLCITERKTPAFRCDCSRERLERALLSVGKDELEDMLRTDGSAELVCQFCEKTYHFSGDDLRAMLEALGDPS